MTPSPDLAPGSAGVAPPPTIFIARDHLADDMLGALAERLRAAGAEVLRGPPSQPGQVSALAPELWPTLLGRTNVAMFSSRSRCTREMLAAAPQLHAIVNPTIGLETVDVAAADALDMVVGHGATPENFIGMAEASVMLMLHMLYDLAGKQAILARNLPRPATEDARARMMCHATVGIIGLGRIGRATMERLLPFGARILVHSPSARAEDLPAGASLVDFDTLLSQSDIVGVFVAVTERTRGMIDARALSRMKPTAYLLNVARGDALDEAAVVDALRCGRIAGAALDTFAVEPLPLDSPLRELSNVILTPHMVGHTREGYASLPRTALENIARVLRGEMPVHCKNPAVAERWQARWAALPPRAPLRP